MRSAAHPDAGRQFAKDPSTRWRDDRVRAVVIAPGFEPKPILEFLAERGLALRDQQHPDDEPITPARHKPHDAPVGRGRVSSPVPGLARLVNGHPAAILDGPGGSQVPQSVIDAVADCLAHRTRTTAGRSR
jgi:hypothetical protein